MSNRKRLLALLAIMACVAVTVAGLSMWTLYEAAFREQREQLDYLAQSEARLIEVLTEQLTKMELSSEEVLDTAISFITASKKSLGGFGYSGEFLLGRQEGNMIAFILRASKFQNPGSPMPVAIDSGLAVPMARALKGKSGTMFGVDYQGTKVLAAYQPVERLGLGIVVKINLAEIRQPFLRAALISAGAGFLIILLGALGISRISTPMIENLEKAVARLTEAQRIARLGNWERDIGTGEGWWSEETYRIFDLDPDSPIPTWGEFFQKVLPDDLPLVQSAIDRCKAGKEPYSIEYRITDSNGSQRTLYERGTWRVDDLKNPVRLSGTIQDITTRRQAEEALDRQKTLFEAVFRDVPDPMVITDADRKLILCNPAFSATFGYEQSDIEGHSSTLLYETQEEYERQGRIRFNLSAEKKLEPYIVNYRRKNGEVFPGETVGTAIRDQNGNTLGYIGVIRDISERIQAEEELAEKSLALEAALENMDQGISMIDGDLNVLAFNQKFLELLDFPTDVFVKGFPLEQAFRFNAERGEYGPGDIEALVEERIKLAERFEPHVFERQRPDGTVIEIRGNPMAGGGFVTTYTDVTHHKRAEMTLRQSEERFRDFSEAASDWFWEMDENLRFTSFSDRFTEISGIAKGDLIGKTRQESGLNQEDDNLRRNIADLEAHRPFKDFEHARTLANGDIVYMSTMGKPIFDTDGNFKGYRGTGRDITERKQVEEDLRRALVRAEEASHAKSVFLATMSHELRTPLNSIIGFSDAIKGQLFGPLGNPKYPEYATDINASGIHLLAVITDILDISKIEAGETEIAEENIELVSLIESAIKMLQGRAEEDGITLSRIFPNDCPLLRADPRHIKQIVINLISNAVKFTNRGGAVSLEITLDDDNAIVLSVNDTGVGIDEAHMETVLEPFGQVGDIYSRKHEGTGLGLPLAKSLAELHGGTLEINSQLGKGTEVMVRFPPDRTVKTII